MCYCNILAAKFLDYCMIPSIKFCRGEQTLPQCEPPEIFPHFFVVKMKRLKQAKDEANREAANYRSYLETEYQRKVSDVGLFNSPFAFCILANK